MSEEAGNARKRERPPSYRIVCAIFAPDDGLAEVAIDAHATALGLSTAFVVRADKVRLT
ncbi:hypothetical protein [Herbaspirillum sp. alder98]|uniref:hypothetical protein n=1 Tax=Herbaspirillum sp. alder98 TaxID=2913096 RepID=UPI001CD890AC|nr:hypothetical protein [Herbaspirillum sp. alder98]MCA1322963.1 hypothetical protein [Herbaspirillum sp. alder98]